MKKILVPIDFSLHAKHALDFALQLASQTKDCQIEVTHIYYGLEEAKPFDDPEFYAAYQERTARVQQKMDNFISQINHTKVKIETSFKAWDPYQPLYKGLLEKEADLIVMGIKGSHGSDQITVGSNASKTARFASCPVIVVGEKYDLEDFKRVLFLFNFEDPELQANALRSYQRWFPNIEITLLRINTPVNFLSDMKSSKLITQFKSKFGFDQLKFETHNAHEMEDGLNYYLSTNEFESIGITSRGRSGMLTFFAGSATDDLVNHLDYPIWICNSHLDLEKAD